MDGMSFLLILIIISCVIVLVVLVKKGKEEEEDLYETSYKPEFGSTPAPLKMKIKSSMPTQSASSQITVYRYCSPQQKKRCGVCDGENDLNATCCCICGQRLN